MPVSVQVAKLKQELARVGVPVPKGKKAVLVKALQDFLDTQHQASVPQISSPVAAVAQAEEGAGKPAAADRAPEQDAAPAPKRAKLDNDAAATDCTDCSKTHKKAALGIVLRHGAPSGRPQQAYGKCSRVPAQCLAL